MAIMRTLSLAMLIGLLAGCAVGHDRGEGYRGEREGFYGEHRDRALDRNRGYNDFRSEGPHGRDTLDRPDSRSLRRAEERPHATAAISASRRAVTAGRWSAPRTQ